MSEPTVANETDDIYCQEPLGLVLPVYAVFSFDLFICEPRTNKPVLFSEPLEPVHQIKLNCLNLFVARAAQIYKLLTFRRLTVTPTQNEPKYQCIYSCDE